MLNLRSVDLNLLPVFEAVYEERNVTKASERLAMSQPAVSHALARLRSMVGDELFVAGRRGAAVTPAAQHLYPRVKAALDAVREGLGETRDFNPTQSERRFTVGILYGPGLTFGQAFADWLSREAPGLTWRFVQCDRREDAVAGLRDGRLDFLVDYAEPQARDLESVVLFRDELVVVASRRHPHIGDKISRKEFLAARHAVHCSLRVPGSLVHIEGALGDRLLHVVVEVREPPELPIVVAGTDLIAVCNRRIAQPWVKMLGLKLLPLPFRAAPLKSYLVWHGSRRRDAGHRWIRDGVAHLARTQS